MAGRDVAPVWRTRRAKRKQSVNALPLNTVACRSETLRAEVDGETKKAWEQPKKNDNNGQTLLRTARMADEERRAVCFYGAWR